jgi:hypothetical protein
VLYGKAELTGDGGYKIVDHRDYFIHWQFSLREHEKSLPLNLLKMDCSFVMYSSELQIIFLFHFCL